MNDDYIMLKSYDEKIVRIPIDKKDEYLQKQEKIKYYLKEGRSIKETIKLLGEQNDK